MMLYVVVSGRKSGRMRVNPVQKQPNGKAHIVLKSKQARIVVGILWSADLKMSFQQVNKSLYGKGVSFV